MLCTIGLLGGLLLRWPDVPALPRIGDADTTETSKVPVLSLAALREHISVFRRAADVQVAMGASDWSDYRFAGTFVMYAPDAGEHTELLRRAVVGFLPEGRQYIVSVGDKVGHAEVVRIEARELVLVAGGEEMRFALSGKRDGGANRDDAPSRDGSVTGGALAKTRFGERTEQGTWRMDRDALLAYYDELLNEPDRLLQVFDSMQPLYKEDGSIEGYRLQTVGEAQFFEAVGFQEGDTVRAVNTLPMTNRRRAEFFIRQVVENDLSAIVIDIERGGAAQRLVYELR